MNKKKVLVGAGLLAIIYATYRSFNLSKSIEYFQYSITGLKFKISNILKPEIIFAISIYNPNRVSVPVQSFFGTIKSGNTVLANFSSASPININGNQQSTIDVSARVNALTVLGNLIRGKKISSVVVDGMIKTGLFDLPILKTVSLSALSGIGDEEIGNVMRAHREMDLRKRMAHPRHYSFLNNVKCNTIQHRLHLAV